MNRRVFLAALAPAAPTRPSVLFLMNPSPETHELVARVGVRFSNCFTANPVCPATRAGILTGCTEAVHGVRWFGDSIRAGAALWPRIMREAGYHTAFEGTWKGRGRPSDFGLGAAPPAAPFFIWAEGPAPQRFDFAERARAIVISTGPRCVERPETPVLLRDREVRVPMAIHVPGLGKPGDVSRNFCYLHDLFPTVCELLGIAAPKVEGFSIKRRVRDHVICTYRDTLRMVRTEKWELIRNSKTGAEQLFDLAADPGETRDLARSPEHQATLAEMRRRLG